MSCKGICKRYQAVGLSGGLRYATGQKRCSTCEIYIKWAGIHCPCCDFKLRNKPRRLQSKIKFDESKRKTEITTIH